MTKKPNADDITARAIIERTGAEFCGMLSLAVARAREGLDPVEFVARFKITHPPDEVSYTFEYMAKPKPEKTEASSVKLTEGPLIQEAEAGAEKSGVPAKKA